MGGGSVIRHACVGLLLVVVVLQLVLPCTGAITYNRGNDCYSSKSKDDIECSNWGQCIITASTYNATRSIRHARWHCECIGHRYEADGTSSTQVAKPTCGYDLYGVPGVHAWTVPVWLANGVVCSLVVAAALQTLTRMYQIDKFRKNLSSLALVCICISFLQQGLGQFLLAARGDGYYIQAPEHASEPRARINTTPEIVVSWFVSTLSYIPILTAYHTLYFYLIRLAMPVMPQLSPLGAIGTPRQIKIMIAAMIILIALIPLTLVSDEYQTLYGSVYMVWKALFGVFFIIAGVRARRMLASMLPSSSSSSSSPSPSISSPPRTPPLVYLAHTPLGGRIAPLPSSSPGSGVVATPPLSPASPRVHAFGINNGAISPRVATRMNDSSSSAVAVPVPAVVPASASVLPVAVSLVDDGVRRHLLRNITLLSSCGGMVSIIQSCIFLWLGLSSSSSDASQRIIISMCLIPLSCLWASFLIATYWIPASQLHKRVRPHHSSSMDSNNNSEASS